MIGFLFKIVVVLVVGVLAYNYFFGSEEEKAQSSKVFGQVKDVAVSVGDLAKSEKAKFDAGKYDAAMEKLSGAYKIARESAQDLDAGLLKRIGELEQRKEVLSQEIDSIAEDEKTAPPAGSDDSTERQARKEKLHREMEKLIADSNTLLKQAPSK